MSTSAYKWSVAIGLFCFLFVFLSSITVNELFTSFLRGFVALGIGCVLGILLFNIWRWITFDLLGSNHKDNSSRSSSDEAGK